MAALAEASAKPGKLRVFVSYSRKDLTFVERLVAGFQQRGFDAYLDKTDIAPGEPWKDRLAALIAGADPVVFVLSPELIASPICRWEVEESLKLGKRVLPVVRRTVDPDLAPTELSRLNWTFASESDDFEAAVGKLDGVLRTNLDWVREHTRLGELARRWDAGKRSSSGVLRGADLEQAERWLAARPAESAEPTELHQAFILASRSAATRRQRMTIGVTAAVAIVSLALAAWALINRNAAVAASQEALVQRDAAVAARKEADTQRDAAVTARKEATAQRDAAIAARSEAEAQRDRAEKTLQAATGSAQRMTDDFAIRLRGLPGIRIEVTRAILDNAEALLEQLLKFNPDTPASVVARVTTLAQIALTIGTFNDASDSARIDEAYNMAKALKASKPDAPGVDAALAGVAEARGQLRYFANDTAAALQYSREAVASYGACYRRDPNNVDCAFEQVNTQGWVGNALVQAKRWDEAIAALNDAITLAADLVTAKPDRKPFVDRLVGGVHMSLGSAWEGKGSLGDALDEFNTARVYMEAIVKQPNVKVSDFTALANDYNFMAAALDLRMRDKFDRGSAGLAVVLLGRARDIFARAAQGDPENAFLRDRQAASEQNLRTLCLNFNWGSDVNACLRTANTYAIVLK